MAQRFPRAVAGRPAWARSEGVSMAESVDACALMLSSLRMAVGAVEQAAGVLCVAALGAGE